MVEGPRADFTAAVTQVVAAGWPIQQGWRGAAAGRVSTGVLTDRDDAVAAMLAAVAGAGLVVHGVAPPALLDEFCDDLRRLGRIDHRLPDTPTTPGLSPDEQRLVDLLAAGIGLGLAAAALHMSRRTADRRLAALRCRLGARTTAQTLVLARRLPPPVPPAPRL
ncbi:helix-turn-helix transcriptional regulator [Actinospica robiniae]|uniref:helix-turn-helix transcriptional regulator n=1 Tax=Actinospica robiniae TaxID=304901 RepID=UPI000407711C|nr:hypothetical protein [Actinospica robiniae]